MTTPTPPARGVDGADIPGDRVSAPVSTRPFRLLVTGGRTYAERDHVYRTLDRIAAKHRNVVVIHGGAAGADTLAAEWARDRKHGSDCYPADWSRHGPAAGPLRNARMIAEGRPQGVVAFPGGDGTADCVRQARGAEVPVMETKAP